MNTTNVKDKINLEFIVSLVIVMVTIIGSTVPLYIHSSSQVSAIHQEISAIHAEMKDFHGRLCAIEERNRK